MDIDSGSPVAPLTPGQAAEAVGIGRWKLYDLLRQGRLRSVRVIAIGRLGVEALRAQHVRRAEERLRIGTCWTDRDLVFPNVWASR